MTVIVKLCKSKVTLQFVLSLTISVCSSQIKIYCSTLRSIESNKIVKNFIKDFSPGLFMENCSHDNPLESIILNIAKVRLELMDFSIYYI